MKWQNGARVGVAVLGVGLAATLYFKTRERPADSRSSSGTLADPQASVQAGQGTQVRYRDGDKQFELYWTNSRQYPDGRAVLENAKLTLEDGTVATADLVESRGAVTPDAMPEEFYLKGNARFQTPDGVMIQAGEATLTEASGLAVMPGPVSFTRGRMSGSGTGGTYERETGVFKLLADARVVAAADAEGRQVDATAATLTFNRAGKAMLFDGQARVATTGDVMTADRATLYLTDDNEQIRVIELRGQARVSPVDAQTGTPDMRAMDIDLAFHEGTEALQRAVLTRDASMVLVEGSGRRSIAAATIIAETATDGKTLTMLDARDKVSVSLPAHDEVPERTITAASLVANGQEGRGLTTALFAGGVSFTEQVPAVRGRPAAQRTGTSRTLTLRLRGELDAIDEAHFQQDATVKTGDITGDADLVIYRAASGQMTLQPARGGSKPPRVTSGEIKVDARDVIDVDLDTKDLHARGDVKTVTTPASGRQGGRGATHENALFNDRDPVFGFGAEFWYDGTAGRTKYQGASGSPAMLRQDKSTVSGQTVELVDETRNLTARGQIESVMLLAASGGKPPVQYRVTAEALDYDDEARVAAYTGSPVSMTGPDGTTTAARMVMTLARTSRSIERLDARGDVRATMREGREALAEILLYDAPTERYTLRGQPLVFRIPNEKPGSCSLWRGRESHFTMSSRAPEFPAAANPGGTENRDNVSCSGPLQK